MERGLVCLQSLWVSVEWGLSPGSWLQPRVGGEGGQHLPTASEPNSHRPALSTPAPASTHRACWALYISPPATFPPRPQVCRSHRVRHCFTGAAPVVHRNLGQPWGMGLLVRRLREAQKFARDHTVHASGGAHIPVSAAVGFQRPLSLSLPLLPPSQGMELHIWLPNDPPGEAKDTGQGRGGSGVGKALLPWGWQAAQPGGPPSRPRAVGGAEQPSPLLPAAAPRQGASQWAGTGICRPPI